VSVALLAAVMNIPYGLIQLSAQSARTRGAFRWRIPLISKPPRVPERNATRSVLLESHKRIVPDFDMGTGGPPGVG
jgi:hypothetical protein